MEGLLWYLVFFSLFSINSSRTRFTILFSCLQGFPRARKTNHADSKGKQSAVVCPGGDSPSNANEPRYLSSHSATAVRGSNSTDKRSRISPTTLRRYKELREEGKSKNEGGVYMNSNTQRAFQPKQFPKLSQFARKERCEDEDPYPISPQRRSKRRSRCNEVIKR